VSRQIEPVHLAVPDADLNDLRERLSPVRWPEGRTVTDTSQGPTPEKLKALTDYWRNSYDWRNVEAELNGWGLHRTTIDGLDIDFLHIRSLEANATPLVMTHGWASGSRPSRTIPGGPSPASPAPGSP
jgi:epoxide hydrolase